MNKAQAIQRIKAIDAELDEENTLITRRHKTAYVVAPPGYYFDASGASCITLHWCGECACEFWDALIELVDEGIQPL